MNSPRPLLIPQKRALLPSKTTSIYNNQTIHKTLNTNTTTTKTTIMQSAPFALNPNSQLEPSPSPPPSENTQDTRLELSFAAYPQPFLDPLTWETMVRRARRSPPASASASASASPLTTRGLVRGERTPPRARVDQGDSPSTPETADQQRRRGERERDYGTMAIRARVRGVGDTQIGGARSRRL